MTRATVAAEPLTHDSGFRRRFSGMPEKGNYEGEISPSGVMKSFGELPNLPNKGTPYEPWWKPNR